MHQHKGFSLIEVMAAGVVASLGLSGVAALLITSVSSTSEAEHRTVAQLLASQLAELVLLNPQADTVWLAPAPGSAPGCGAGSNCSAEQFAARNYLDWQLQLALVLPQGTGLVCRDSQPQDGDAGSAACDGVGTRVIKLFWAAPEGAQRLVLETGA
jgi:type IV pilus assembly protein PilV